MSDDLDLSTFAGANPGSTKDVNFDDIQKAIDLIEKLPKPELVEAVLITKLSLLPGIRRCQYEGKNYFIIGKDTWEREVKPQFEKMEAPDYSGNIGAVTGIPVIEDDELVKMILLKWAEKLSSDFITARKPPKGWTE